MDSTHYAFDERMDNGGFLGRQQGTRATRGNTFLPFTDPEMDEEGCDQDIPGPEMRPGLGGKEQHPPVEEAPPQPLPGPECSAATGLLAMPSGSSLLEMPSLVKGSRGCGEACWVAISRCFLCLTATQGRPPLEGPQREAPQACRGEEQWRAIYSFPRLPQDTPTRCS